MKATLEFNLPEERVEHIQAVHAGEMASAISNLQHDIRSWLKHGHQFETPEDALAAVTERIQEVSDVASGLQ